MKTSLPNYVKKLLEDASKFGIVGCEVLKSSISEKVNYEIRVEFTLLLKNGLHKDYYNILNKIVKELNIDIKDHDPFGKPLYVGWVKIKNKFVIHREIE
jgi:hypothetical protein